MDDFLEKCTKISLKLGIPAFEKGGQSKAARAKTINIDTNILHQIDLEFDVDSKNRIKKWSSHLKNFNFGLLLKFGTPCILMDYLGIK